MKQIRMWLVVSTLLAFSAPQGFAAVINELESNGTAVNNTLATAQAIPASAFTLPVPGTAFNPPGLYTATIQGQNGNNDVDFFSFFSYGGRVYLDMDNTPAAFDPIVALFNSTGTLLAYGDDSPLDAGSATTLDSFVGVFELPGAGTYYIAVSENANFPTTALTGTETALTRPDGAFGGYAVTGVPALATYDFNGPQPGGAPYTLHASVAGVVPEPGSFVLMSIGLVAVGIGVRRRHPR